MIDQNQNKINQIAKTNNENKTTLFKILKKPISKHLLIISYSEEVNQVFGSGRLRKTLYTGIYKDFIQPGKKYIIYKFNCHCGTDYVGKTSQKFHVRIDQHVLKILNSWFDVLLENSATKYFSAIGQNVLDNHK